jgi:hypothetical protein
MIIFLIVHNIIIIVFIAIIFIASLDFILLSTSQVLHILSITSALGYWCLNNNALLSEELIRNVSSFLKQSMFLSVDFSQQLLLMTLPRCAFACCIVIVVVEMLRYLMSYIIKYYENIGADRRIENIRDGNRSDTIGCSASSSISSSSSSSSSSGNRLQQQQTGNNDDDHDDDIDINEDNHDHENGDKDDVDNANDVDQKDHHDDRGGEEEMDEGELDDRSSFQFASVLEVC